MEAGIVMILQTGSVYSFCRTKCSDFFSQNTHLHTLKMHTGKYHDCKNDNDTQGRGCFISCGTKCSDFLTHTIIILLAPT